VDYHPYPTDVLGNKFLQACQVYTDDFPVPVEPDDRIVVIEQLAYTGDCIAQGIDVLVPIPPAPSRYQVARRASRMDVSSLSCFSFFFITRIPVWKAFDVRCDLAQSQRNRTRRFHHDTRQPTKSSVRA
jgi:hypothetical protein